MKSLSLGLAIGNDILRTEVTDALRDLPMRVLLDERVLADVGELLSAIDRSRVDVLLLDLTGLPEPLERLLPRIKALSFKPSVIAVHDKADANVILGAVRAGVSEFLYPPVREGLRQAITGSRASGASHRRITGK